jgi:hypothetical protein
MHILERIHTLKLRAGGGILRVASGEKMGLVYNHYMIVSMLMW